MLFLRTDSLCIWKGFCRTAFAVRFPLPGKDIDASDCVKILNVAEDILSGGPTESGTTIPLTGRMKRRNSALTATTILTSECITAFANLKVSLLVTFTALLRTLLDRHILEENDLYERKPKAIERNP